MRRERRQPRLRPRLSRTLSRARWREYGELLDAARAHGYAIVSLEDWIVGGERDDPLLVLRHDVDQHPRSALRMAAIEERRGLRSTWYFRWRTADARAIARLRGAGHHVGFHYETLSRLVRERRLAAADDALVDEARAELRREAAAFCARFGPMRSVCPHGDTRVPGVSNAALLRGQDPRAFGVEFDGNHAMHGRRLGHWLTDRSRAEGSWGDGVDPLALLAERRSPILCLTHPHNWVSGAALWLDRLAGGHVPMTTRSDRPRW
jgi:hypothetical protein